MVLGGVALRGLRCTAVQGDPPSPTELLVDVRIELDLSRVADSDAYDDVVDLTALAATIRESIAARPRLLLETLAVHAARDVRRRFSEVQQVRLRVIKNEPAGMAASEESVEVNL